MFFPPGRFPVDPDLIDLLGEPVGDGNGQPLPSAGGFNPVPVLPLVLFILYIVKIAENIRLGHLIIIAEPGKILGLMNGDDHGRPFVADA